MQLNESFLKGNDELVLQKNNKRSVVGLNNDKKTKRSNRPDIAFKNLTTSQKLLFKQKSLPIVRYLILITIILCLQPYIFVLLFN